MSGKPDFSARGSGILMPIFSLPSPYGIGAMGRAAREFIDFLAAARQSWWQILPVGPTSYGDSPYQSPSVFAGNPYLIDLDLLIEDGLLTREEVGAVNWGDDPGRVDYGALYRHRLPLLEKAAARGWERDKAAVEAFAGENAGWLPEYALFMALKERFGMRSWLDWPDEALRMHQKDAVEQARRELEERIRVYVYVQFLFFRQWAALREYAHQKGVGIIGDIPIYVALDSVDVWASPECFRLDEKRAPVEVAGVPPDYFCEDGQLWGNPLYDYEAMALTGYGWWIRRVGGAQKLYDVIRIDHFRGFESYWAVPYGDKTAKGGRWIKGPGMALVGVLRGWFHDLNFIAEDLGAPSPEVVRLLEDSGFPGMKVLEFAFDPDESSSYLPHAYTENCVCYTGTHDNSPLLGWRKQATPGERKKAKAYLGLNPAEGFTDGMLRAGMGSVARLFVAQMPDWLEMGDEARINAPGTPTGNWQWRMLPGQCTADLARRIARMTVLYDRQRPLAAAK
ncbi:MAG: 4-alpha-glucanotransferase [Acutalibacteraceae bacterium]|jgi:4-alpha-glucanotransferase